MLRGRGFIFLLLSLQKLSKNQDGLKGRECGIFEKHLESGKQIVPGVAFCRR